MYPLFVSGESRVMLLVTSLVMLNIKFWDFLLVTSFSFCSFLMPQIRSVCVRGIDFSFDVLWFGCSRKSCSWVCESRPSKLEHEVFEISSCVYISANCIIEVLCSQCEVHLFCNLEESVSFLGCWDCIFFLVSSCWDSISSLVESFHFMVFVKEPCGILIFVASIGGKFNFYDLTWCIKLECFSRFDFPIDYPWIAVDYFAWYQHYFIPYR